MTSTPTRRSQFGLRPLFAATVIVAAYFGSWPWFEERAYRDVKAAIPLSSAMPFSTPEKVAPYVFAMTVAEKDLAKSKFSYFVNDHYYVWLFGWTVRLPMTTSR